MRRPTTTESILLSGLALALSAAAFAMNGWTNARLELANQREATQMMMRAYVEESNARPARKCKDSQSGVWVQENYRYDWATKDGEQRHDFCDCSDGGCRMRPWTEND